MDQIHGTAEFGTLVRLISHAREMNEGPTTTLMSHESPGIVGDSEGVHDAEEQRQRSGPGEHLQNVVTRRRQPERSVLMHSRDDVDSLSRDDARPRHGVGLRPPAPGTAVMRSHWPAAGVFLCS